MCGLLSETGMAWHSAFVEVLKGKTLVSPPALLKQHIP